MAVPPFNLVTRTVLHVAQPWTGGVPRVVEALIRDQLMRGWSVVAASPPGGDLHRLARDAGGAWVPWKANRLPGRSVFAEWCALRAIVTAVDPDVVHLHSAKAGFVGRWVLRGRRATIFEPNAWSFEAAPLGSTIYRASLAWERFGARWSDAIVCVSDGERSLAETLAVSRAHIRVIPNGVDLARFPMPHAADRAAARARIGLDPDVPLAICVGRLSPQKNQGAILDIWPSVREEVPHARVALVGDGPDRAALETRAVEGVDFVGSSSDVASWLAAASVVVQPSRWEGMSLAVLEALAAARSLVVTDVSGMKDVVTPGTGVIVPPDDLQALAGEVVRRLADSALADREGQAARERAEREFDLLRRGARVATLYDEVLSARSYYTVL